MKSKIFAIMLAVLMVVSMLPVGVFAAETAVTEDAEVSTLDALLEAIESGVSEITLTNALEISKDVTIESDKAVAIDASAATDAFTVTAGTLTLGANITINSTTSVLWVNGTDASVVIDGTVINTTNSPYNAVLVNVGSLTLKSGAINAVGGPVPLNVKGEKASAVISGGKVTTNASTAVRVQKGNITISGGEVITTVENPAYVAAWALDGGVITVTGGLVKATANARAGLVATTNGTVVVKGGTVYGVVAHEADTAKAIISGGTIYGSVYADDDAALTVSGGIFTNNVSAYLASGVKQVRIGDLDTPAKRGHDFIGWSFDGVKLLSSNLYIAGSDIYDLIPVFEANELGNTEILPRLYPVTVIAGEGGTVEGFSGKKDLVIAFGAGRTIDIVPEEGYEIQDVIVNGKYHLGAVESYKIISAHMAYTVEAVFAPIPVYTPVYTENFDGDTTTWVNGGTTEAVVLADGTLAVTSTGGDPNINYPEAFGLSCDDIDVIRIKYINNTENTSFQIFFTNEANPGYSEAGSFKATCVAGENEIVIDTSVNELWTGTLSNMRIDLSNGEGSYIVESISFETVSYAK